MPTDQPVAEDVQNSETQKDSLDFSDLKLTFEKRLHDDRLEGLKLKYDSMKHLTTLCTGSILLLFTMQEKLDRPNLFLVGSSFFGLIVSIIISFGLMGIIAHWVMLGAASRSRIDYRHISIPMVVAFSGFSIAMTNVLALVASHVFRR